MAGNWIKGAIRHPGAFRRKAEAAGMSTGEYARTVKSNPSRYDTRTKRQADLAGTLRKMPRGSRRSTRRHGRKGR
jgi:hypothetical protein